jgi:hypothetical protein
MITRRELLVGVALVAAAAPSPAQDMRLPKVELDYDPEADFASFRTYAWKDPARAARDPKAHTSIVWYVDAGLRKKGLEKVDADPDLYVRYYAKARTRLKGTPSQGESRLPGGTGQLSTSVDFSKVAEGTLILELQRGSDEKVVWRAGSDFASIDTKRLDAEIRTAVGMLLAKYPPPEAAPR